MSTLGMSGYGPVSSAYAGRSPLDNELALRIPSYGEDETVGAVSGLAQRAGRKRQGQAVERG